MDANPSIARGLVHWEVVVDLTGGLGTLARSTTNHCLYRDVQECIENRKIKAHIGYPVYKNISKFVNN